MDRPSSSARRRSASVSATVRRRVIATADDGITIDTIICNCHAGPTRLVRSRRCRGSRTHFLAAGPDGDPAKAFDYATRAAGDAMNRYALEEAAHLYSRAFEVLE